MSVKLAALTRAGSVVKSLNVTIQLETYNQNFCGGYSSGFSISVHFVFSAFYIVVGSRRLMAPDALQPKAYCTNPGL